MKKLFGLALAFLCSISMFAIEPVDGVYKLSTGAEAKEFADGINDGSIAGNSKVELTQDLDLGSVGNWVTIGTDAHKFVGTFDGKGYRVVNMTIDGGKKEQGFFGVVGAGAVIKNLIMAASCNITSTDGACLAAFVGCCNNDGTITFENCGNEAAVKGTKQNNAAFVGCNYGGGCKLVFNNCYNTGKISGGWENGAFSGWCGGGATFNNCWNIGEVTEGETWARGNKSINNCYQTVGNDGGVIKTTNEKVASGELAFLLNGSVTGGEKWYQNIGTDNYPVPFATHAKVYANGEQYCDGSDKGTVTYSNTNSGFNRDPHTDADGWCSVCHQLVQDHLTAVDGSFEIGSATDLKWFAAYVDQVATNANAKLTANIEKFTEYIGKSSGKAFAGIFDGQEHTINIEIVNNGSDRTGLFAYVKAATIKNLVVEGSATSAGNNCVGGLGGRSDDNGTLIENVIVKTNVSYTGSNGDATCGGFFANMEGQVTLKNCAFLGSISTGTSEGNGGLVGWAGGGGNNKYINCYVAPSSYTKNGNSADFARNNPSTTKCYTIAPADEKLASGEFCNTINDGGDNWYQRLSGDKDSYPVPFSSHGKVYANASYNCDGTAKGAIVYANVDEEQHDPHQLTDGFCSVCNGMIEYVEDYMTPVDGWYEISNNKQMRWFAAKVKTYRVTSNEDSNARINARLMNDIDFTGIKDYQPIGGLWGQGNARYAGEFDGQFNKITNLNIDLDQDNVGIFGVIAEGAVIKNFTVDATCSIKGNAHVGIVGEAWKSHDGEIHLLGLGNEAAITGTGNNVGAILGVNMNNGGYVKCNMAYCYSTGAIKGNAENGQLTGWSGDNAYIENCYAIGEAINCDGFGRLGGGSTSKNIYSDKELGWGPILITNEMLTSGELCAKLGDKNFRQTIGEDNHPVLNSTHGIVKTIGAVGYATMFIEDTDVTIPAGIEAYTATVEENKNFIILNKLNDAIAAEEPVILEGAEGYYSFVPTTGVEKAAGNVLVGTNVATKMADGDYILANTEANGVGFYPAKVDSELAAGKAYLHLDNTSNVKFFGFSFGEETGIEGVQAAGNGLQTIFDLSGRKVVKAQKGIFIKNGKKVIM